MGSKPDLLESRRGFVFKKRLNIINDNRPKSLITYDSTEPPLSPSATSGSGSGSKHLPPVIVRAMSNLSTTGTNLVNYQNNTTTKRPSLGPLEDLVICAVCLERLKQPKMLNCQHTFCLACLQSEFLDKNSIRCPNCLMVQNITDIDSLPSNLYIDSLLKLLKGNTTTSPSALAQAAPDYEFRCIKCQIVVAGNNLQKCRHCKQSFCQLCWNTHTNELLAEIRKLDQQLNGGKEKINHKLEAYKDRINSLKHHITAFVEEQISLIQESGRSLIEQAEGLLEKEIKLGLPILEEINDLKQSINISETDSNHDKVATFVNLHRDTTEIFQKIIKIGESKIIFNKENFTIEIHTPTTDENTDGGETEGENQNVYTEDTESRPKTGFHDYESLKTYYKEKRFKSKFSWSKCSRPSGIGLAPWTHKASGLHLLYIAGSDSRLIYGIETVKGRIIHRISHEDMIFPNSICFSSERREIFVCDKWKHCIFVFSEHGELLRSLCSKGDLEGYLRSPEGIAIGTNNTLLVCDTGNDRIQCLDTLTGAVTLQFGLIERDQVVKAIRNKTKAVVTDLKAPTSVGVYEEHIIVLDSGNRRVKVFNKNGEKLSEFGTFGKNPGQFTYPEALAIDQFGFIWVGDGGNTRIDIYEPNGKIVQTLGSTDKFRWVSGIAVTKDFKCIVSDYKTHSVQIFE